MSFSSLPKSLLLLSFGIALGASTTYLLSSHTQTSHSTITIRTPRPQEDDETNLTEDIVDGIEGLIGNTKLVRIRSLSLATGCDILAKAEVLSLSLFSLARALFRSLSLPPSSACHSIFSWAKF